MDRCLWRQRFRRALLIAALLRLVPFVRLVGLNGSMATGRMEAGSDIDLFIAAKDGRLYTCRLLVILLVRLLGVGVRGEETAGRICLNRFSSDRCLEIAPRNPYHAAVFRNLIPLVSIGDAYRRYREENAWMADFGAPVQNHRPVFGEGVGGWARRLAEAVLLIAGGSLERWARRIQEERIAANAKLAQPGSQRVVTDTEVRYHFAK